MESPLRKRLMRKAGYPTGRHDKRARDIDPTWGIECRRALKQSAVEVGESPEQAEGHDQPDDVGVQRRMQ